MGDQLGGAERRASITGRAIGVVAACALLMCAFAPGAFADGLKPDPSPESGGLGPDSAATPAPAPAKRTAPKPVVRATPSTPVAPIVTRTVVVQTPAAPAPAPVTRAATTPAQPKAKPKPAKRRPAVAKHAAPKVHHAKRATPISFGVRFTLPSTNAIRRGAPLALPAALGFLALVCASGSFVAFALKLRRGLA
jgi:hypothetical protein